MDYRGTKNILSIPSTVNVVIDCWNAAEEDLQKDICSDYPAVNEEFITQMFHGRLAKKLRKASDERLIEKAFLTDLKRAFPDLSHGSELKQISHRLIADVTLHKRKTEMITGGDLGLVITRPQVADHGTILKVGDYRRGLLCQAKIKRSDGKWGGISGKNQRKALSGRLPYLALLLYSYKDLERRELSQFLWQLCDVAQSIKEIVDWLRHDNFPSPRVSSDIINGLATRKIGTDDKKILDEVIAPTENSALELRIGWPKGDTPSSDVRVYTRHQQNQKIKNYIYVRVGH